MSEPMEYSVAGETVAPEGMETLIGSDVVEDAPQPHSEVVEDARGDFVLIVKEDKEPEPRYILPEVVAERLEDFVSEVREHKYMRVESADFIVTAMVGDVRRLLSDGAMGLEEARKLCDSVKASPGVEGLYICVEVLDEANRELYGL